MQTLEMLGRENYKKDLIGLLREFLIVSGKLSTLESSYYDYSHFWVFHLIY